MYRLYFVSAAFGEGILAFGSYPLSNLHPSFLCEISGMSTTDTSSPKTVEVRQSAGQEEGEGTIKPIEVVHEIPAKEPAAKQE
ncbi:hypothetical protein TRIUR3_17864 [Triticum urartu]|uniref:Uncharacterized protein n=2 Tax=Triticum TaxID=4564 RepID=A0A9R0WMV3_TRITD|nr:hypothetical protein TRIUR3_17864 [Triticum urartu]VAI16488.1 unnamed protein product [Triticum turgidum subsp. durum]